MSKSQIQTSDSFSQDMTQNFYWGVCVDNNDPLMLGRVRVKPVNTKNIEQVEKSAKESGWVPDSNNESYGLWSPKDPWIHLPFLPYFINQIPKPEERVMIFYFDRKRSTGRNKFYMLAPFSSPLYIKKEDFRSSKINLDDGYDNSAISVPSIKNTNNTYKDPSKAGVFSEPVDIAINGRDTADIVIKDNDVLLRAGKHFKFERGEIPVINNNRAFLQLSKLSDTVKYGEPQSFTKLVDRKDQLKFLIEYYCTTMNTQVDVFSGGIRIIQLPQDNAFETQVGFFDYDTTLSGQSSYGIIYNLNIQAKTFDEFVQLLVGTVRRFHDDPTFCNIQKDQQFPFYYRPGELIRNVLSNLSGNVDFISVENMSRLINSMIVNASDLTPGYGVVYKNFKQPEPFNKVQEIVVPASVVKNDNTVAALGADQLFLLSHKSTTPGKDQIDLQGTIYGISGGTFNDVILPNTSSTVRGEELMELLQLIVNFLITHDHPYPMLPPSPIARASNITTDDLLKKMQESYQKVLNSNIRIN